MVLIPCGGPCDELAVPIAGRHLDHGDGRKHAGPGQFAARARDQTLIGHLAQHVLQRDPIAASDAEGARDLALAGFAVGRQKVENVLPRGKLADRLFARGPLVFRHLAAQPAVSSTASLLLFAALRAGFLAAAFFGAFLAGPLALFAAMSATASSSVTCSGSRWRGSVALTLPCLT